MNQLNNATKLERVRSTATDAIRPFHVKIAEAVWNGMGGTAVSVSLAVVGISSVASISASRDLVLMGGTRST